MDQVGQQLSASAWRSDDVAIEEDVDFSTLHLKRDVINGLLRSNFLKPSPIQREAIPLGRLGCDIIMQAKSGIGKTCVFVVIALEMIDLTSKSPQALILAPTREIAQQIYDVFKAVGRTMNGLVVKLFVGGTKFDKNAAEQCHICVGTPGRIGVMIKSKGFKPDTIRLLVLDEADKLMDNNFQSQINDIFNVLPEQKQMIAASATYTEPLANFLSKYMHSPKFIRKDKEDVALLGIKQYYFVTKKSADAVGGNFGKKRDAIVQVLTSVAFSQCVIFTNDQHRGNSLCQDLRANGWPAMFTSGQQDQKERYKVYESLRSCACRILISTDLCARGIDAEHVNLVINLDVPSDTETYFHRIGRAGRFGSRGIALTLVTEGQEHGNFMRLKDEATLNVECIENIENDLGQKYDEKESQDVFFELRRRQKMRLANEAKLNDLIKDLEGTTLLEGPETKNTPEHNSKRTKLGSDAAKSQYVGGDAISNIKKFVNDLEHLLLDQGATANQNDKINSQDKKLSLKTEEISSDSTVPKPSHSAHNGDSSNKEEETSCTDMAEPNWSDYEEFSENDEDYDYRPTLPSSNNGQENVSIADLAFPPLPTGLDQLDAWVEQNKLRVSKLFLPTLNDI